MGTRRREAARDGSGHGLVRLSRLTAPASVLAAVLVLTACGGTTGPGPDGAVATRVPGPIRAVTDQPTAADGGLECPASIKDVQGQTVPHSPQGVDGGARLLPDRTPAKLVVCGYPVMSLTAAEPLTAPYLLSRRTLATGEERDAAVEALTWAPRGDGTPKACTMMAGDETAYLVGASYDDATVWVAAKADANSCSDATNGDFLSRAPVGITLDELFGSRSRPSALAGACGVWSSGRLGDDTSLAPPGDPVVTVCRDTVSGPPAATTLDRDAGTAVLAAVRALPTTRADAACSTDRPSVDRNFRLVLTYAVGPSVWIGVRPGCGPPVAGGALAAADGRAVGDLVDLVEASSPPVPGPDPDGSVSSDGSSSTGGGGSSPQQAPPATGSGITGPPGAH